MKFKCLDYYMNQIQPIREFTQQTNILHNVLRGKDEYNNLVQIEHQFFAGLKNKFQARLQKLSKQDMRAMKMEIPSKPLLFQARRNLGDNHRSLQGPSIIEQFEAIIKGEQGDLTQLTTQLNKLETQQRVQLKKQDEIQKKDKILENLTWNCFKFEQPKISQFVVDFCKISQANLDYNSSIIQKAQIEQLFAEHDQK